LRENPLDTLVQWYPAATDAEWPDVPVSVKLLRWMFITGPQRSVFRKMALRLLGVR
jgi:hypothetical protein